MAQNSNDTTYKARPLKPAMTAAKPAIPSEMMKTDATMTNTGLHAQAFARTLTKGLDPEFPVK